MQYNIYVPQIHVIKFSKLKFDHAAILYFMRQFLDSDNIEYHEEDGKKWYWFASQKIIDELPLLKIKTKRGLRKKLEPILATKLIERKKECNKTYYYFSKEFFKLYSKEPSIPTMSDELFSLNENICSINHNTNIIVPISNIYIKESFFKFWEEYPNTPDEKLVSTAKFFEANKLHTKLSEILQSTSHYKNTRKVKDGYIYSPIRFLEEVYPTYVKGIPNEIKQNIPRNQKFKDKSVEFLEKIEWLHNKWLNNFTQEEKNLIIKTDAEELEVNGTNKFTKQEVEVIRQSGGVEFYMHSSYWCDEIKEKIERLFKNGTK